MFALAGCASAGQAKDTPLRAYMQARVLDAGGDARKAAAAYGRALAAAPKDAAIAARAYRLAITAGDMRLALRAAAALNGTPNLPADAHLLLIVDDLSRGDFAAARRVVDGLEETTNFGFLAPALRAWAAFGAGGDAIAELERGGGLASAFNRDTRALLLLAGGQWREAASGLRLLSATDGRQTWLRLAAAAQLARLGQGDAARDVLAGDDPPLVAARAQLDRRQRLAGAIVTAQSGVAFLLARLSADLSQRSGSDLGLALSRIASFADGESDIVRMSLARSLSLAGQDDAALAAIASIGGPLAVQVPALRIDALLRAGRQGEALAAAAAADASTADPSTLLEVAEVYAVAGRHDDAVRAYKAALDKGGVGSGWRAWMLYGAELDAAGDWPAAKAAIERALSLAPEEPAILNQLGFAMLERGDDLAQATRHIAKANRLQPDNAAITDSLGWAFHLRGRTAEAIPLLERAAAMRPDEPEIGEHLGDAYWTAGRKVEARYAWTAARAATEDEAKLARLNQRLRDGLPARR